MPWTNTKSNKLKIIISNLNWQIGNRLLFLVQVLLCDVKLWRLGKYNSFWEFFGSIGEKTYFLALGTTPLKGVGFIAGKITVWVPSDTIMVSEFGNACSGWCGARRGYTLLYVCRNG